MKDEAPRGFSTQAVHTGRGFTGQTGAVMPPVYLTSTFERGNADGFDYTRSGNPNFRLLDECVAAMEGARFATSFASRPDGDNKKPSGDRHRRGEFVVRISIPLARSQRRKRRRQPPRKRGSSSRRTERWWRDA